MLLDVGCRISAGRDLAAELEGEIDAVGSLLDVTDAEGSSISTIGVDEAATAPAKRPRGRPRGSSQKRILVELGDDAESKEEDGDVPVVLKNKFIKLAHLIPPHPEKGTFDMETIRKLLYFSRNSRGRRLFGLFFRRSPVSVSLASMQSRLSLFVFGF